MGINEYDELRGENIALRREAEELRAQLEIAHGALDDAERAIATAREEGRAAGYGEAIEKAVKVAEDPDLPGYYQSGRCDADCSSAIAEGIRALVPADGKKP